jgi:hypothetical protein
MGHLRYPQPNMPTEADMPLDFSVVSREMDALAAQFKPEERARLLREAQNLLRNADADKVRENVVERKKRYPWLVANPVHSLRDTFAVSALPAGGYSVAASDGSNIPPDRHSPVQYCILNVSKVVLTYGEKPAASLEAATEMLYGDEKLYVKGVPLQGELLGAKMAVRELQVLLETALSAPRPCAALQDGTLILWRIQSQTELLPHFTAPFRAALEGFGAERIPLLSYISYPGARDLCNALRVALCDTDATACETCKSGHDKLCKFLGDLRDRELLQGYLAPGYRTDLFATVSDVVKDYGADNAIIFCYLEVGGEIARVEMPKWLAEDLEQLDFGLGVALHQCALSGDNPPYPLALMEAHESAVIDVSARRVVDELMEREFARRGLPYTRSGKDRSKRRRGV